MITRRRSTAIGLTIYNPDLLRKEDLIAQFVARRPLLELLLDDLRRAGASGGVQHHLLIGSRGMGKTLLLRRLRFAIEDDTELAAQWFPLVFPEEQYNLARLSDFWVNCLDALCDMLEAQGRSPEAAEMDEAIQKLPAMEARRADAALGLLTQWVEQADKGLVLLLDNAGLILERLHPYHRALREALQQHQRLLVIGAASAPIAATYEATGVFHNFFQVHELRGLTSAETRQVLLTLAALCHTPRVAAMVEQDLGHLHALRVLTGGNPRVLVVLYQALAQGLDSSMISQLEHILDVHTPSYKAILEALSPPAQRLLDAMCLHWHPLTAATLAALPSVRLEASVVSTQLDRLCRDGVVEEAPTPAGEALLYQVAERFFNVWYLMRANRRQRRKLIELVDVLPLVYAPVESRAATEHFLPFPALPRRAATVLEPALRPTLTDEGIRFLLGERQERCQSRDIALAYEGEKGERRTPAERRQVLQDLERRVRRALVINRAGYRAEEFWQCLGGSWVLRLEEKQHLVDKLETSRTFELQDVLQDIEQRQALFASLLGPERTRLLMEAIRSGDMADVADVAGADVAAQRLEAPGLRVMARLEHACRQPGPRPMQEIDELRQSIGPDDVYMTYRFCALLAAHPPLCREAARRYRETLQHFPQHTQLWNALGNLLSEHLQRYAEAEAAYRQAIALDPRDPYPWCNLGHVLKDHLQRYVEAEAAYRRSIALDLRFAAPWQGLGNVLKDPLQRYKEAEAAYCQAIVLAPRCARPWYTLGTLLHYHLQRYREAEAAYRQALTLEPHAAYAWYHLGNVLKDHLQGYQEAAAAYRQAIALEPRFAHCWYALGTLLHDHLQDYEEAAAAYHQAIAVEPRFAYAWNGLGNVLKDHLQRYQEAEAAYRHAIAVDPRFTYAWNGLGNVLKDHLQRYQEAETAYRQAIALDACFAYPWHGLGTLLHDHLQRYQEAEAAYRQAIALQPHLAASWYGLGTLLHDHLQRTEEVELAYRQAAALAPTHAEYLSNLACFLFTAEKSLQEAEKTAQQALRLAPENLTVVHTLACILARRGKWAEAAELAQRFLVEAATASPALAWPALLAFCRAAVQSEHAADAVALLDTVGSTDRWRPLREALNAIAVGNETPLLHVAPEIRQPAEVLVAQLLPARVGL